ncbi:unnamed protein product [Vitrella brassicaformis CCMP3155]|uniref:Uncharacterized protein n=1 Tax=Vitrella brassicaformis (strain CCMP3155) TaxID=1169540 RepID=A0A0G4GTG4_VITBC|nr:unnamed protein product [Vitrella brassicaformis CCMP3155]|eukprot:CEM34056.1 unnamed protein product [Vitrella brassicaformis CCMP3155]
MAGLRPAVAALFLLLVAAASLRCGAEGPDDEKGEARPKSPLGDIVDLLFPPLHAAGQAAETLLETAGNMLGEGFLTPEVSDYMMGPFDPLEAAESLQGKLQALTRLGLAEFTDRVPRAFWEDVFSMPSVMLANTLDVEIFQYFKEIPTLMCLALVAPHILRYEPPVQNAHVLMQNVAIFHAVAAFTDDWHVFFGPDRRAPKYMRTHHNRQEAGVHACYEFYKILIPRAAEAFAQVMPLLGYNPLNTEPDENTPAGMGNLVARESIEWFKDDGYNRNGTMLHEYNGLPYEDWTGYKPVNDPHELVYPTYWQPLIEEQGVGGSGDRYGYNVVQQHITPQAGRVRPFFLTQQQVDSRRSPPIFNCVQDTPHKRDPGHQGEPPGGDDTSCVDVLKERAWKVIEESLELDEKKKAIGEYFDNKLLSLGTILTQLIKPLDMTFEEFTVIDLGYTGLLHDATIVAWKEKIFHEAVRPQSFIQHFFHDEMFHAYVPKEGVKPIMGRDWKPYLRTMPHTEYPSGSTCFCRETMEFAKIAFDGFDINGKLRAYFPKGSSLVETGMSPTTDLIVEWESFDQIAAVCAKSRVWTGVHFEPAIDPQLGGKLCDGIGAIVFERIKEHSGNTLDFKDRQGGSKKYAD